MIIITFKCNQCTLLNRNTTTTTTTTNFASIKLIISDIQSENEYKELKASLIKEKK